MNLLLRLDKMNEKYFNILRLQFARKRRGMTAKEVANSLGVTTRTFSKYENGSHDVDSHTVRRLAKILDFPESFFYRDNIPPLDVNCVSFRSLARMSAKVRDKALCAGEIALELSKWLDDHFELPQSSLPQLTAHTPEAAAEALRSEWNLGTRPIKNIIHLLESKGVRVFSLDEDTDDMDGFSFWQNNTPFIFLNMRKTMERSRFDAAHELGHLILHKHGKPSGKAVEAEANSFASAFLMPEATIRSYSGKFISMSWVFEAKAYWKVSAAALIRRLRDVGIFSEWHYRKMVIELSSNGFSKKEPSPIQEREISKLFPLIFQALKKEGKDKNYIASILNIFPKELDSLLFNLTLTEVHGCGGAQSFAPKNIPSLQLIK